MQAHALSQGLAFLALVVSPVLAAAQTADSPAIGFRNVVAASEPEESQAQLRGVDHPPSAQLVALARVTDYERNALTLINSNPRLRELMRQREALERKYWQTRKTIFR